MDFFSEITGIKLLEPTSASPAFRIYDQGVNSDFEEEVAVRDGPLTDTPTMLDRIHLTISGPRTITEVVWGVKSAGLYQGYGKNSSSLVKYKLVPKDTVVFDSSIHLLKSDIDNSAKFDPALHWVKADVTLFDPTIHISTTTQNLPFKYLILFMRTLKPTMEPPPAGQFAFMAKDRKIACRSDKNPTWIMLGETDMKDGFYYV